MAGVRFKIEGLSKLRRALAEKQVDAERAVAAGMFVLGNEIMTTSKRRVPVDTGTLRGSGYVTQPEKRGRELTVELDYGGPAKAYAEKQHELPFKHPEGGQRFYLKSALDEATAGAGVRVARLAARKFERGDRGLPPAFFVDDPKKAPAIEKK